MVAICSELLTMSHSCKANAEREEAAAALEAASAVRAQVSAARSCNGGPFRNFANAPSQLYQRNFC